ncbi:MAG: pyridoxamine 5'-phosphate oxidase family protein [Anaerolineales bacterium]|nr:pyridoxamine 5'-phosphate oxidase family protein [Anaerolineales bacterium]
MTVQYSQTTFTPDDIQQTQPEMKIGLLATVNSEGKPHVTLLSSLMACGESQLCFGQFTEGLSKKYLLANPKTGFLIMGLDKNFWRGKAAYTHLSKAGKEFDQYNMVPMFRYNAYFGVHTVYYFDLLTHSGKTPLPMNRVIIAAVQTMIARTLGRDLGSISVLNDWSRAFITKLDNLKFLAYIDEDGYPVIIPAIQAQCLDSQHIIFSTSVYKADLEAIPVGAELAVFSMALTMEDVLACGQYLGIRRTGGVRTGVVKVDWVYNPMPPVPGQIYPRQELMAIKDFV